MKLLIAILFAALAIYHTYKVNNQYFELGQKDIEIQSLKKALMKKDTSHINCIRIKSDHMK